MLKRKPVPHSSDSCRQWVVNITVKCFCGQQAPICSTAFWYLNRPTLIFHFTWAGPVGGLGQHIKPDDLAWPGLEHQPCSSESLDSLSAVSTHQKLKTKLTLANLQRSFSGLMLVSGYVSLTSDPHIASNHLPSYASSELWIAVCQLSVQVHCIVLLFVVFVVETMNTLWSLDFVRIFKRTSHRGWVKSFLLESVSYGRLMQIARINLQHLLHKMSLCLLSLICGYWMWQSCFYLAFWRQNFENVLNTKGLLILGLTFGH